MQTFVKVNNTLGLSYEGRYKATKKQVIAGRVDTEPVVPEVYKMSARFIKSVEASSVTNRSSSTPPARLSPSLTTTPRPRPCAVFTCIHMDVSDCVHLV